MQIKTYRPTMEQFQNFNALVKSMEDDGAHLAGIAKIIPPAEWIPKKRGYHRTGNIKIPRPTKQTCHGADGAYFVFCNQEKPMTVAKYKKMCEEKKYRTPSNRTPSKNFWKELKKINSSPPVYGAGVPITLMDQSCKAFNIPKLGTILDLVEEKIEGVNTPWVYFGMYRSMFAWHTEDMDLYSINYIHYGAPKTWYAIPPAHGRRFEKLAAAMFPRDAEYCPAFLRHKTSMVAPDVLEQYHIPYDTIVQEEKEIIITFPYGYHAGFNNGYNCAESINFATERWIEYGKRANLCCCKSSEENVKIDMTKFVERFQADRLEKWLAGDDDGTHPEHNEQSFAGPKSLRLVPDSKNRPDRALPEADFERVIICRPDVNFADD